MKIIGFIGLGTMGKPMVVNLLRKGYSVVVYNRSEGKTEELVALGAIVAESIAEVATKAQTILTMVSNDQAVEQIYLGEDALLANCASETVFIDCSTISPALVMKLVEKAHEKKCRFLDAPVTGSKPGAIDGTLCFMVGGNQAVLKEHEDLLYAMGRDVVYMGPNGSGAQSKLAHNTIVGINCVALIEGMTMAAKAGVDAASFLKVVSCGAASSKMADLKGQKIMQQEFSVQFALKLMLKDLNLASELSGLLNVPTPLLDSAKNIFKIGEQTGQGELDLSALARVYSYWTHCQVGSSSQN